MHISPLNWQSLNPIYSFTNLVKPVDFFDFQPNAKYAIQQFLSADYGSALILKAETSAAFFNALGLYLSQQNCAFLLQTECNAQRLLGYALYLEKENQIKQIPGNIEKANQQILILNLNTLLTDISQWDKLKQALLYGEYEPYLLNPLPIQLPTIKSQFKLMLIGERDDIAALADYDTSLSQFSDYAEIENDIILDSNYVELWKNYIQTEAKKQKNITFSHQAITQLLTQLCRESENQYQISISPALLKKYLIGISHFYPKQPQINEVESYFNYLESQSARLHHYAIDDILSNQTYLETEGETIGQINGLSVVEYSGVPYTFGEPLRISCNVQYGEGEIQDIERKVELAGNIHAKGILLAQSCLSHLLELPTQLPFSAQIAFEQSYAEIDGDSASLAIFCVLISALTELPIPQSIAVTGAIDQFGNILSVGGVNQKIEGFFEICKARQLTGKQGVIIPKSCLSHLSLKSDVVEAVRENQFNIWAVSDVFETTSLLFQRIFYDKDHSDNISIYQQIHQNILQKEPNHTSGSIWQRICKIFKGD